MSFNVAPKNLFLRSLSKSAYETVAGHLQYVEMPHGKVLVNRGDLIEYAYFPDSGMISIIASAQGQVVEVGTIGKEGFCGINLALGVDRCDREQLGQVDGYGWKLEREQFKRCLGQNEELRRLTHRFILTVLHHASQSAMCNRLHKLEERCARWLLLTHDRGEGDTVVLIQEFIAMMLGVRRAGVNSALRYLTDAGVVQVSRGAITVCNRKGLEDMSCSCYKDFNTFFLETMGFPFQQY